MRAFQSCQIWYDDHRPKINTFIGLPPGNFEMLSRLNELDLCRIFVTEWQPDLDHSSVKKSPHNSNWFRHESISKLPDLKWWPQTKNIGKFAKLWNALTPKRVELVRTFFKTEWQPDLDHYSVKKVRTSPTRLGERAFQNCSYDSLNQCHMALIKWDKN